MLLFVYTINCKRFVIFTCRYFKLSWNTTALSQSKCRNFSCSSIKGETIQTWSRGTNSRLPFAVNVNLSLSNVHWKYLCYWVTLSVSDWYKTSRDCNRFVESFLYQALKQVNNANCEGSQKVNFIWRIIKMGILEERTKRECTEPKKNNNN